MHGLNEGHIAPYTDIEFQLTKNQTYITMKSQVSTIGFIMVHGLNEVHIAPYTDI